MPRRLVLIALVPASALLLVLFGFSGRAGDNPVLTGDVGANNAFAITLADATGTKVTHLDPGTYTLVVHDHSTFHNFHLLGPGVNVTTDVGAVGDSTFTVTLSDGTYTFQCDPHALSGMKATFTVGTPPTTATTTAKLTARVVGGAKIRLVGAAHLTAGPAVITVTDTSRKDNFHLVGPGVNKATGIVFKGTVTWKVTLAAGTYKFRSDRRHGPTGSFTVSAPAGSSGSSGSAGSSGDPGLGGY